MGEEGEEWEWGGGRQNKKRRGPHPALPQLDAAQRERVAWSVEASFLQREMFGVTPPRLVDPDGDSMGGSGGPVRPLKATSARQHNTPPVKDRHVLL